MINKNLNNIDIPKNIDKAIDKGIERIKKEKKSKRKKLIGGVTAACLAGTIIIGVTSSTYADDLPIFKNIIDYFTWNRYENYDKYASDLNITKEVDGIKVTINKVIYDGIDIEVFYTIEGEEDINKIPEFWESKTKINGKNTSFGGSGHIEYLDEEGVYVGNKTYSTSVRSMVPEKHQDGLGGYIEIPDEFVLSIELRGQSKGFINTDKWSFDIPVTNEKVKGMVKEYDRNIKINSVRYDLNINKLITTPINTVIQMTCNEAEWDGVSFIAFDDKGRFLEAKGGGGFGTRTENNDFIHYFEAAFREIYDDSESITFIPYDYIRDYSNVGNRDNGEVKQSSKEETVTKNTINAGEEGPIKLAQKLNLDGETKLTTKAGEDYGVINKVEVKDGKTKLYIKSEYNVFAVPELIRDKDTGKEIVTSDNFNIWEFNSGRYVHETGELLVEYDGELTGNNYEVVYYDHTNEKNIYINDSFTIELK